MPSDSLRVPGTLEVASKRERLERALALLRNEPGCTSGLEAYRQLSEALNIVEDEVLGAASWAPPRTFTGQPASERLYPTYPESMLPVPSYPGVTALWHATEVVFISRYGAVEVRKRDDQARELYLRSRGGCLLFEKGDAYGDGVWHEKNKV